MLKYKGVITGTWAFFIIACAEVPEIPTSKRGISIATVTPVIETQPVDSRGDAADDPAIWVHPIDPRLSRILGTDKKHGLMVYDLSGEKLQDLPVGRVNNVDLRQAIVIDGVKKDVAIATNRTDKSLDVFEINKEGKIRLIGQQPLTFDEPYGACMYRDMEGKGYAFINDKDGSYQQWQLRSLDPLVLDLVRGFRVATQPEGCVADDLTAALFVGEEGAGVWKLSANAAATDPPLSVDQVNAGVLVADVEGMDIYRVDGEVAYLIVSSQGDFTYAVYQLGEPMLYKGSFRVIDDSVTAVDGVEETDGLAVSNKNLGAPFEKGMIVLQDGYNRNPKAAQNFKYISWRAVAEALELEVIQ